MHARQWIAAGALSLAACSVEKGSNTTAATSEPATAPGVTRDEIAAPTPSPTPAPTAAAIQTQPGPKGNTVALTKAQVDHSLSSPARAAG